MTVLQQSSPRRRRTTTALLVVAAVLTLAACGGDDKEQSSLAPTAATAAAVAGQPPAVQPTAISCCGNRYAIADSDRHTCPHNDADRNRHSDLTALHRVPAPAKEYPGSELVIEQTLAPGSNYSRYYVYYSEGLKQYGLLTVPRGQKPDSGWPVIIFNHGFIPPNEYRTTERYVAYVDGFARSGYIVFRPDYRGHDQSEGTPSGAYGSPDYVIDVLNATASLKQYPDADPQRIGMWGHSMGGWITLRAMVTDPDIQAGVIWGGVVGAYEDLLTGWRRGDRPAPTPDPNGSRGRWRNSLTSLFGSPESNPEFWQSLSANYFLDELSGPIQLHHTQGDESVPVEFSEILYRQGLDAGMPIELVTYPGDNHNISGNFGTAMSQSVAFFDRWLKQPLNLTNVAGATVFTGNGLANLRSGPGTSFNIVGQMQGGEVCPSSAPMPTGHGGRWKQRMVPPG
ncbi:MAG: alpha/beta fold hydrolase [Anaerolineae bacterium]|nr:alpha/beta fold hydrolase [Anaerolineae bacterium]